MQVCHSGVYLAINITDGIKHECSHYYINKVRKSLPKLWNYNYEIFGIATGHTIIIWRYLMMNWRWWFKLVAQCDGDQKSTNNSAENVLLKSQIEIQNIAEVITQRMRTTVDKDVSLQHLSPIAPSRE